MEEIIIRVKTRARKNFSKGFNCAECVLASILETIDTGLFPRRRWGGKLT